ncbi:hypothetical protein [Nocardioides massiliensis]|uniref:Cobalamin biosynthesis Mg chelatase CobN n=1 Tax=Nocardioides massiliensis TaxID=1325935 RepID=A0ABT9NN72_9ACTN|nr:hypothetical protein [Nocardioides massiliensis]MDP9821838.1 cobalamin biosynthesis Mg chelatase CobN [Nocardioides massiliensis]
MAIKLTTPQVPTEVTRPLYAVVGATDLVVEKARAYAGVAQTIVIDRFGKVERDPKALRDQTLTLVATRVDGLTKDAKAAQDRAAARVLELQADAQAVPAKVEAYVAETLAEVTGTYGDLAARGEKLIGRVRTQESTQETKQAASTTTAKAKTTRTQGTAAAKKTAKKTTSTAKKSAKKSSGPAKSSAKATGTAAKKSAKSAAKATADAGAKVGD